MRTGLFTLALGLVASGTALLAVNLGRVSPLDVLRWWPVLIVVLGVEVLVAQARARARGGAAIAWDRAGVVLLIALCLALAAGHAAVAAVERVGWSWPWEAGLLPTVKAERVLSASLEADGVEGELVIPGDFARAVRVSGGAERVEAELGVTQPGRSRGEAERLASEWDLQLVSEGPTVSVRVTRPAAASGVLPGNCRLVVRVPPGFLVRVVNERGDVEVQGVRGCRLWNRGGGVRVEDVPGEVDVLNELGPVTVVRSGSPQAAVRVQNSFGAVEVAEATGPVQVRNRSGPVRVSWDSAPGSECRLETEAGPLEVWLPAGAPVRMDAQARSGAITLPESWGVRARSEGPELTAARGAVGEGSFPLVLRNRCGDISVGTR